MRWIAIVIALISLVSAGQQCLSACFREANLRQVDASLDFLGQSEEWMTLWLRECSYAYKAAAAKQLAILFLESARISGPTPVINGGAKKDDIDTADLQCSVEDFARLYGEARVLLGRAGQELSQEPCGKTSYDNYLLQYYDKIRVLIVQIQDCQKLCETDGGWMMGNFWATLIGGDHLSSKSNEEYETEMALLAMAKASEQRAMANWAALPTMDCDCCWHKTALISHVYANVFFATSLAKFVAAPIKSPLKLSKRHSGDVSVSPYNASYEPASYELIKTSLFSVTVTNQLADVLIDVAAACPQFTLHDQQYATAEAQLDMSLASNEQLLKQIAEYSAAFSATCSPKYDSKKYSI